MIKIILIFSAFMGAVFVHEMAHVLAGLTLSWQCHHIIIGPIKVSHRDGSGWRISLIKSPYKWGGSVAITPKSPSMVNKSQLIKVIGAGPSISLLTGLLLFISPFPNALAWLFIVFALITGLPYRRGNVYSDGGKIRQLLRNDETAEIELSIMRMGTQVFKDGNFANVSIEDIEVLMNAADIRDRYRGTYYMWSHYKDLGQEDEALRIKDQLDELSVLLPIRLKKRLRKPS